MQICKKCTKHNSSLQYFTLLSMLFCTFAPKIFNSSFGFSKCGMKAQQRLAGQAKRHPGLRIAIVLTPCKGKSIRC